MRILMVLERDFPPDLRVENEITSLMDQGHEVILACYSFGKKYIHEEWNACQVYKKPIPVFIYKSSVGALKLPFYFLFWRNFIRELCKKLNPDAIHIHDLPLAIIGAGMKKKFGIKFVLDLHENWPAFLNISNHTQTFLGKLLSSDKQWRRYEAEQLELADRIIVVVDEAKSRLVENGVPSDRISVVSNLPKLSEFNDLPPNIRNKDEVVLFYGGGLNKHRGLQYVIDSLPILIEKTKKVRLWIVGEGSYRSDLEKRVRKLNIADFVKFIGWKPYKELLSLMAKSDICLIPHIKSEHTDTTIPHKLFQYMYAGIPVISSNCEPIIRIIKETNSGLIYKWDSPQDFAEKFQEFFSWKSGYDEKKIKRIIENRYCWEREVLRLSEIYN